MKMKQIFTIVLASFITGLMPAAAPAWKAKRIESGLQITGKDQKPFTIPLNFSKSTFFKPAILCSHDKNLICVVNGLNETEVWNVTTQKKLFDLESPATPLCFSPQGKWLVASQTDGSLQFWNMETKLARTLPEYVKIKKMPSIKFNYDENIATLTGTFSYLINEEEILDKNSEPIQYMPRAWVTAKNDILEINLYD